MIKYILAFFIFLCVTQSYIAQDLTGRVLAAETGEKLSDVSVKNLNTGKIEITDINGYFHFEEIDFPVRLEFSYVGYATQIKNIKSPDKDFTIRLQKEIGQLSEVILRSSNIPQELKRTPAAVSLISESELDRTDNFNLVQNLNYVPGVFVNQGALNTNKINIRGVGSRAQYSTNRIKAYINGIPLTTAEGELTLDDFDPEYLDRIEIYKGPVSSTFGAGLGGSINLYTKRNRQEQTSVGGEFSYGSFNTSKSRANISYVKDSMDISINYNNVRSDGYRDNGQYDRISLLGNAGITTKSGNHWSFLFSTTNLKAYIPSSLSEEDFRNNPQKAAFTWGRSAGYESYDKNIFGVSYEHNFSKELNNQTSLFYTHWDGYEPRPFDILDDERSSIGFRTKFNYRTSMVGKNAEFSFGAESMFEWYETLTYENNYQGTEPPRSVQGDRLSFNEQYRNYLNLFAQMNLELTSRLIFEAGLNFNNTSYELTDRFPEDEVDQSGNYGFDSVFSPRIGLNFEAFNEKFLYASVSHGFSTPTVAETLTPEGLINTDLQTETGLNYEVGFKGNWFNNRLYTELNLYTIQIRNLLVARRVGQDQYVGVNAGKADRNGIEFTSVYRSSLAGEINMNLFLNSNFNFFSFDKFIDQGENYSGNEIPGSPEYMISPGAEFQFRNYSFNLNYQAFGGMALDDANTQYTDPYQLLNLKLAYQRQFLKGFDFKIELGANNLFDEKYAASVVTNAVGFGGSAPRYYYPGNPRNYYGAISLKYSL